MGCGNSKKNPNYKSCERFYNNTAQAITAGSANQLVLSGSRVVDTGISIDAQQSSYTILKTGLYRISGDVVINASAVGVVTLAIYMDGVALPCSVVQQTVLDGYNSIHTETDLSFDNCCCNISKNISFVLITDATAAGSVTHICTGIIKNA